MACVANKRKRMGANSIVSIICPTCASKRFAGAASKAAAGKRKARENATSASKRKKGGAGKKADRTAPRTRLSVEKMALLAEVDKGILKKLWLGGSSARCGRSRASSKTGRTSKSRPTQHGAAASRIARGNSNAYIVRDTHYIGENLCCAGARYSAGEVACTIPALYRDHYCNQQKHKMKSPRKLLKNCFKCRFHDFGTHREGLI